MIGQSYLWPSVHYLPFGANDLSFYDIPSGY